MSTTRKSPDGALCVGVQELNIANVARDYHDNSTTYHDNSTTYHDNSTTFHNHGTAITITSPSRIGPLDRLLGHVSHGALHDSAERGPDTPKCHPETRTAVQSDIMSWIRHGEQDDAPKRILWLSGPAGSGKTAIAGTIADECYRQGLLAASFFFSAFAGSVNRRTSKLFVTTLVYSLLQHEPIVGYKEEVLAVIERDPMVFERHLDQQLDKLVLEPLRKVAGRSDCWHWPKVITVDGLDECEGTSELDILDPVSRTNAQKEILSILSRACADPAFPFRIIIASRPEPTIRQFFSTAPTPILNIFLDNKYNPDADIQLYLEAMFSDLRRRFNLPSTWASKDVIDLLVEEASGQFIYAATVVRFVDSPGFRAPQQQLVRVLEWRRLNNSKPFAPLDMLYRSILDTSPEPLLAVKWLRFVDSHVAFPGFYNKNMLESYSGETEHLVGSLTSLVRLVDERGEPEFHFYHKSLLDFLQDPHRSSELHVNWETLTHFTQDRYYQVLQARGPQSTDPLTSPPSQDFLDTFCSFSLAYIDLRRRYTSGDVEWWLANLHESSRSKYIPRMFASVHEECEWYRCLHACGIWRKAILRHCREHGWRVPTTKEMLRDRFKKSQLDIGSPQRFPLRAPLAEPRSTFYDPFIYTESTTTDSSS